MKKTLAILFFVCLAGVVFAQDFRVEIGKKTNKKVSQPKLIHIVEGNQEGQLLVLEPKSVFSSTYKLRLCDMNWRDEKSVVIPDSKCKVEEAFRTGNTLHILFSYCEKDFLRLRHMAYDVQTLNMIKDEDLFKEEFSKGESGIWTAVSLNGEFHGLVCSVTPNHTEGKAVAMMFDKDMKKLWERKLGYNNLSQIVVNNEGVLATLQTGTVSGMDGVTAFRVNMASEEGTQRGEYALKSDVDMVNLLNCSDSTILVVAAEAHGNTGNRFYKNVLSMVINLQADELRVGESHTFTDAELLCFVNEKGSPQSDAIGSLLVADHCATPEGGAAIYQRGWMVFSTGRNGTSTTVYSFGMLLVRVDMNGKISTHRIPMENRTPKWPTIDMFQHGERLYVICNESKDEPDGYNPDKIAEKKKISIFSNCGLAAYWFTPKGRGEKRVVVRDEKAVLLTELVRGSGNHFYCLTSGGLFPNLTSIVLPTE